MENNLRKLYETLSARARPEDVVPYIQNLITMKKGWPRLGYGSTLMLQDFRKPLEPSRQVKKAQELFSTFPDLPLDYSDCTLLERVLRALNGEICKEFGRNSFGNNRLNRQQRADKGMDISKRRYNKLFRHLARTEKKLKKYARELKKREFTMMSKSSLSSRISWEDFKTSVESACFIAYYTARCNRRSQFLNKSQSRPYDRFSDLLFKRCLEDKQTNWWAVAHVYSSAEVLGKLSDEEKGKLLGVWYTLLTEIAGILGETWDSSFDRKRMVVRKGNDSTTWNTVAGAWNKARMNWMSLLYSMGLDSLLDKVCPGKVLRLMAADVVRWHDVSGGDLEPDTAVWCDLPLPWEVLSGDKVCTRKIISETCGKYKLDPIFKGWIAPSPSKNIEETEPTPELVHGISVSSPQLGDMLRRAKWFSGKQNAKWIEDVPKVVRDKNGFVTEVK